MGFNPLCAVAHVLSTSIESCCEDGGDKLFLYRKDPKTHIEMYSPVPTCIHKEHFIHYLNAAKFGVEHGSSLTVRCNKPQQFRTESKE